MQTPRSSSSNPPAAPAHRSVGPFELFVLVVTLVAVAGLVARTLFDLPEHARESLRHVDTGICLVFLADFLACLVRAPGRLHYLRTRGWIDLLSSLPGVHVLRWGRLVRGVAIARIVREMRQRGSFFAELRSRMPNTVFFATLSLSVLLLAVSSVAIIEAERGHGGNIQSGEDAIWWSIVTLTTVGYGDLVPQTLVGRALAIVLMTVGVGIFGTFTSFLGSSFTRTSSAGLSSEVRQLRQEIERLQQTVARAVGNPPHDTSA